MEDIRILFKGDLLDGHDQFMMLELNYEKLKNFMEKLEERQIFQGLKFHFCENNARS